MIFWVEYKSKQHPRRAAVLVALACAFYSALALSADSAKFIGTVIVEWLDDTKSDGPMKLLADFAFQDADGKLWLAPKGHVVDNASMPPLFRSLIGPAFAGRHRKASLLHDYFSSARTEPWPNVQRMFYQAILAEGVSAADAKLMYMALYAEGSRWEVRGSSCYRSCHAAAASLVWRPVVTETDLHPVIEWIDQENPGLEEIEQRVTAATQRTGPHLFAQGH